MLPQLILAILPLLEKAIPDKDKRAVLANQIATSIQDQTHKEVMGQLEVNKTEAQHRTIWVAGWRPFIGWVCGIALMWHFVAQPITVFVIALTRTEGLPPLPVFEMGTLITILGGMLGLGGLRTYEKQKGLTK